MFPSEAGNFKEILIFYIAIVKHIFKLLDSNWTLNSFIRLI